VLLLTASVAPVKFMRVSESGYVFLAHGLGIFSEIWVVDGINGIYAFAPVEHQQLAQQV
jgi:hypothetical protein